MSGCFSEIARTAGSDSSLSQIVTIRPTPASRARSMTASRSASNCGACRFTWLSISIRPELAQRREPLQRGEEGVAAVEVHGLDLARQVAEEAPGVRPAIEPSRAGFETGQGILAHDRGHPVHGDREGRRPLRAAEAVGER